MSKIVDLKHDDTLIFYGIMSEVRPYNDIEVAKSLGWLRQNHINDDYDIYNDSFSKLPRGVYLDYVTKNNGKKIPYFYSAKINPSLGIVHTPDVNHKNEKLEKISEKLNWGKPSWKIILV